jgi:hypothetical protein
VKVSPSPFAKGCVRYAYYAQMFDKKTRLACKDLVLKTMISHSTSSATDMSRYVIDLETQTVASKMAFEFTDALAIADRSLNLTVKYLRAKLLKVIGKRGIERFYFMETKFYDTDMAMVKFTNNWNFESTGSADPNIEFARELSVAFSHYSHHITNGYLLVCDVQGIVHDERSVLLLTDPAIHCPSHMRFGRTNLGQAGIDAFFAKHTCNSYCSKLGLSVPAPGKCNEANKEILNQKCKERTNKEDAKERARLHRLKNNYKCTCQ